MNIQQLIEQIRLNDRNSIDYLRNYIYNENRDLMEIRPLNNMVQSDRPNCWIIINSQMIDHESNTQDLKHITEILNTMIDSKFDISAVYNVSFEFGVLMSKISILANDLPAFNLLKPLYQLCMRLDQGKITYLHACLIRLSIDTCHFYAKKLLDVDQLWILDSRFQMPISVSVDFYIYSASILTDSMDYYKASIYWLVGLNALGRLNPHDIISNQPFDDTSIDQMLNIPTEYASLMDKLVICLLIEDGNLHSLKQIEMNEFNSSHRTTEYSIVGKETRQLVQYTKQGKSYEIKKHFSELKNDNLLDIVEYLRIKVISRHILSFDKIFTSVEMEKIVPEDDLISNFNDKEKIQLLKQLHGTKISDESNMIWFNNEIEWDNQIIIDSLKKNIGEMMKIIEISQNMANDENITDFFLHKIFENRRNGSSSSGTRGITSDNMTTISEELRYNKNRRRRKIMPSSTMVRLQKTRLFGSSNVMNSEDDQMMESEDSGSDE